MPKPLKPAGKTAAGSRRLTQHGSKNERAYFKATGALRRNDEKPGFTRKNPRP